MQHCVAEPRLRWLKDRKLWQVEDAVCWVWNGGMIEVPVGFCTDLASIPRPLTLLQKTYGNLNRAAILHDWAYYTRGKVHAEFTITRKEADDLFYKVLIVDGVARWRAWTMYYAVRINPLNWRKW